ncbi:MAG: hypothetical protein J6X53_01800 [Abditibacteriota bacterium]|nr:hypothetical protein [Abditibacteriota bacterium]
MANCKFCGCPTQNNEEICEHCAKELDDVSVAGTDVKMVPPEAKKLNWGAFWFSWLWAVNHRIYFPLVILIVPILAVFAKGERMETIVNVLSYIISIPIQVFLLLKGGELAWQRRDFESVEEYVEVQKAWVRWIFYSLIIAVIVCLLFSTLLVAYYAKIHGH